MSAVKTVRPRNLGKTRGNKPCASARPALMVLQSRFFLHLLAGKGSACHRNGVFGGAAECLPVRVDNCRPLSRRAVRAASTSPLLTVGLNGAQRHPRARRPFGLTGYGRGAAARPTPRETGNVVEDDTFQQRGQLWEALA